MNKSYFSTTRKGEVYELSRDLQRFVWAAGLLVCLGTMVGAWVFSATRERVAIVLDFFFSSFWADILRASYSWR